MKGAAIALTVVAAGVAAWLVLAMLSGGDVVRRSYSTLDDARRDNLFERGWLPEILPPSAREIRTSNNLDLNTSVGQFAFLVSDYPKFEDRTQAPAASPEVREKIADGFIVRAYTEAGSTWLFYCKPNLGYCEYEMRTQRG